MKHLMLVVLAVGSVSAWPQVTLVDAAAPYPVPAVALPSLQRMAPRIIMVHGGLTPRRLYLTDWKENFSVVSAISVTPAGAVSSLDLAGRQFVDLTLYWEAPRWERFLKSPESLAQLDPNAKEAGRGRLYLPQAGEPAIVVYANAKSYRTVSAEALDILTKYGVPIGAPSIK